jgi:hypothetical protein
LQLIAELFVNFSKMNKYLLLISALLSVFSAYAQRYAPNHIDLRASYCIAFHKNVISENSPILADAKKFTDLYGGDWYELVKSSTASSENDLSRLQSYMLPRIKFLDAEALILATQQFSKDHKFLNMCQSKCSELECLNQCAVNSGYKERASSCMNLNWIPF